MEICGRFFVLFFIVARLPCYRAWTSLNLQFKLIVFCLSFSSLMSFKVPSSLSSSSTTFACRTQPVLLRIVLSVDKWAGSKKHPQCLWPLWAAQQRHNWLCERKHLLLLTGDSAGMTLLKDISLLNETLVPRRPLQPPHGRHDSSPWTERWFCLCEQCSQRN